jgi:hypothetical protein
MMCECNSCLRGSASRYRRARLRPPLTEYCWATILLLFRGLIVSDKSQAHDSDGLLQFSAETAPAAETNADMRPPDAIASLPHQPASTGDIASAPPSDAYAATPFDDQDWLALFGTESASESAPATIAPVAAVHQVAQSAPQESAPLVWSRSAFVRLVAASVAAFFAGAVSVLWGLHALHSPPKAESESLPPSSLPAVTQVSIPGPSVEAGISPSTLRHLNQVAIAPPRFMIAGVTARRSPSEGGRAAVSAPIAVAGTSGAAALRTPPTTRAARGAPGAIAPLSQQADRASTVDASALTRLANVPSGGGEELLPETSRAPAGADPALAPNPRARSGASAEEYAVRRVLHSYEEAYEGLDVAATAAVWPSVDRRALSRAFDTLKSQGLDFKNCVISVADSRATANCRGTLQFVRKVGNPAPLTADQQWVFTMRRFGADWQIDEVSATQTPVLAAQRIRGEE